MRKQSRRITSRPISAGVRGSGTVARLGGDEFTVIMSNLPTTERVGVVTQEIFDTLPRHSTPNNCAPGPSRRP